MQKFLLFIFCLFLRLKANAQQLVNNPVNEIEISNLKSNESTPDLIVKMLLR
jgi:hypothetical protein